MGNGGYVRETELLCEAEPLGVVLFSYREPRGNFRVSVQDVKLSYRQGPSHPRDVEPLGADIFNCVAFVLVGRNYRPGRTYYANCKL